MSLSIIVARAANGVIGRDGDLPWHLPDDFKQFKALTTGHPIVMGRRTHESIGRPLPNRRNIVVSATPGYTAEGCDVAPSLERALEFAGGDEEVFVIGGARLYSEALPRADRLYVTEVDAEVEGDVHFPAFDAEAWKKVSEESHPSDERHAYPFSMCVYDRVE